MTAVAAQLNQGSLALYDQYLLSNNGDLATTQFTGAVGSWCLANRDRRDSIGTDGCHLRIPLQGKGIHVVFWILVCLSVSLSVCM